jgi:hypothetical protein
MGCPQTGLGGEARAGAGSPGSSGLPWGDALQEALAQLYRTLRSPTEHESTPLITQLMQARMRTAKLF